jgi:hypothetical protein
MSMMIGIAPSLKSDTPLEKVLKSYPLYMHHILELCIDYRIDETRFIKQSVLLVDTIAFESLIMNHQIWQLNRFNIRLFDKIETEQSKQSIILNQTISQDAEFATIIDNATQRLVLPWIGQTK